MVLTPATAPPPVRAADAPAPLLASSGTCLCTLKLEKLLRRLFFRVKVGSLGLKLRPAFFLKEENRKINKRTYFWSKDEDCMVQFLL